MKATKVTKVCLSLLIASASLPAQGFDSFEFGEEEFSDGEFSEGDLEPDEEYCDVEDLDLIYCSRSEWRGGM